MSVPIHRVILVAERDIIIPTGIQATSAIRYRRCFPIAIAAITQITPVTVHQRLQEAINRLHLHPLLLHPAAQALVEAAVVEQAGQIVNTTNTVNAIITREERSPGSFLPCCIHHDAKPV